MEEEGETREGRERYAGAGNNEQQTGRAGDWYLQQQAEEDREATIEKNWKEQEICG